MVLVIDDLEYGGAQRQVVETANSLAPDVFDVHVCCLDDYVPLAATLRDGARRLHVVRKRSRTDVTVVFRLAKLLERLKADIVHSYLFSADIAARLAGRLARTAVVVGSERNTGYRIGARQRWAYRLTRRCVDVIIANSNAGAAYNSRLHGLALSRYRVVHNGVDTRRFVPRPSGRVRKALGLMPEEPVVGVFASFKRQKNHALFFGAFRRVVDRVPNAKALVVGDQLYGGTNGSSQYAREMRRLVDHLGIRGRCLFLGNRRDVAELYCACDITALPSLYEGTPNVLLESMACGVPVVATDVSDNSYVVSAGGGGHVVPLGDERAMADRICDLILDEASRREKGRLAREWVEKEFSLARLAEKSMQVYLECLGQRARA